METLNQMSQARRMTTKISALAKILTTTPTAPMRAQMMRARLGLETRSAPTTTFQMKTLVSSLFTCFFTMILSEGELFDTSNIVVCQYDRISKARNKWKFNLKNGVSL